MNKELDDRLDGLSRKSAAEAVDRLKALVHTLEVLMSDRIVQPATMDAAQFLIGEIKQAAEDVEMNLPAARGMD